MTNNDLIHEYVKGCRTYNAVNHVGYKGNDLYSYSTKICTIDRKHKKAIINDRKYSRTTSKHQSRLMMELKDHGYSIKTYDGPDAYYWNFGYMGAPCLTVSDFA